MWAMSQRTHSLRTARRNWRPAAGALYTSEDVTLVADIPLAVIATAIARGDLRTVQLDGMALITAEDLAPWIKTLDERIAASRSAA